MTACDLSASAKPWDIQVKTVKVIFEEFYEQVRTILLLRYFHFYVFKAVLVLQCISTAITNVSHIQSFSVCHHIQQHCFMTKKIYCKVCHILSFIFT
jgi:hypothetical protein